MAVCNVKFSLHDLQQCLKMIIFLGKKGYSREEALLYPEGVVRDCFIPDVRLFFVSISFKVTLL